MSKKNKQDVDLPGEVLRKEGKEDCDAIILEKALESENDNLASQNQNDDCESGKEKSDIGKGIFLECVHCDVKYKMKFAFKNNFILCINHLFVIYYTLLFYKITHINKTKHPLKCGSISLISLFTTRLKKIKMRSDYIYISLLHHNTTLT